MSDLENIELGFTCEEYVQMLESEHVQDIKVIDVRSKSNELDYLILATLHSNRHRKAVGSYLHIQVIKHYSILLLLYLYIQSLGKEKVSISS